MKKNIAVFLTGGIAVYKSVGIVRKLMKNGFNVKVAMSNSAQKFITAYTFQALTHEKVYTELFNHDGKNPIPHIELADWADYALVIPATANIIAKMALGLADDIISTTLLAINKPKYIVPAMNEKMLMNQATQRNLKILQNDGVEILQPVTGMLAEGYEGKGRLPEESQIIEWFLTNIKEEKKDLVNKKIIISAGSTIEPIDPVRYISNYSSGKMGYALAKVAQARGADVVLISGPTNLPKPKGVKFIQIKTTVELEKQLKKEFNNATIVIMAAAVSDYRVSKVANKKIKKDGKTLDLELIQNPDIIKELGKIKESQILIGFAAETDNLYVNAQKKLISKNADMIIGNDVSRKDIGFGSDKNELILFTKNNDPKLMSKADKIKLSDKILDEIVSLFLTK